MTSSSGGVHVRRLALCLAALAPCVLPWSVFAQSQRTVQLAQVIEERRQKQDVTVDKEPLPQPTPDGKVDVDLTGVWYHLRHGHRDSALVELGRLQTEHPTWKPPVEIRRAIDAGDYRAEGGAGNKRRDRHHTRKAELSTAQNTPLPEPLIRKRRDTAGALGLGWHLLTSGAPDQALTWFALALNWSHGAKGGDGMGWTLVALDRPDDVMAFLGADPALRPVLADLFLKRAVARLKAGQPDSGDLTHAAALGRNDAYEAAGWAMMDEGLAASAQPLFAMAGKTEGAIFGLAAAMRKNGQGEAAGQLACDNRTLSVRMGDACADSLEEAQLAAYRDGRFVECIALADEIGRASPGRAGGGPLVAWSLLKSGRPDRAAALFAGLYDRQKNPDLAEGLVISARAAGDEALVTERIEAGDVLLAAVAARQSLAGSFDRKQFELAATSADPQPGLSGRDGGISAGIGVELRHSEGTAGLGRLDILGPRAEMQASGGGVRLAVAMVDAIVTDGTAAADAQIGSRPRLSRSAPLARAQVQLPVADLRVERPDWTWGAQLGTTPLNGPLAAQPTGSLSATYFGDSVNLGGRLFSQSVVNSMLSFTGIRDPVTGRYWGRVIDSGFAGQVVYLPVERVSFALNAEAAQLTGIDVEEDGRVSVRADGAYDLLPDGFDHARLGPFLSFAHFDHNLSGFTLGQGGYYSPDQDDRVGVLLDLLTEEGKRWQIESKLSAAYGIAEEASAAPFPLSPGSLPKSPAFVTRGFSTDANLRAGLLVADRVVLSGFGRYSTAAAYRDFAVGLTLSVSFDARDGLVSRDLANSLLLPFR